MGIEESFGTGKEDRVSYGRRKRKGEIRNSGPFGGVFIIVTESGGKYLKKNNNICSEGGKETQQPKRSSGGCNLQLVQLVTRNAVLEWPMNSRTFFSNAKRDLRLAAGGAELDRTFELSIETSTRQGSAAFQRETEKTSSAGKTQRQTRLSKV